MEESENNEDDDKKEITADNEYEGVIHRNIIENEKKIFYIPWIR